MLTSQEQKTLQFIRNYLAQHGYAPRFKEIGVARLCGISLVSFKHIIRAMTKVRF